jgi:mRNA interferase RelE/StbE
MVKKVADFQLTQRFNKDYKALPKEIQESFEKKLILFLEDMRHPSLRVKRIQGTANRWEGSVTMNYRFTFELVENTAIFMTIGTHDILNRQSY